MPYSLTMLKTAAECDAVLKQTQARLRELNHQAYLLGHERQEAEEKATDVQVALIGVEADIAGYHSKRDVLPDDSVAHDKNEARLRDSINRRAQLTDRQAARGSVALLVHELKLSQVQVQITEVTTLATAVTAHKATL